eukprot:365896-Chlamydomonas_euryale.AAC.17
MTPHTPTAARGRPGPQAAAPAAAHGSGSRCPRPGMNECGGGTVATELISTRGTDSVNVGRAGGWGALTQPESACRPHATRGVDPHTATHRVRRLRRRNHRPDDADPERLHQMLDRCDVSQRVLPLFVRAVRGRVVGRWVRRSRAGKQIGDGCR